MFNRSMSKLITSLRDGAFISFGLGMATQHTYTQGHAVAFAICAAISTVWLVGLYLTVKDLSQ